jgi:hypothetical protein
MTPIGFFGRADGWMGLVRASGWDPSRVGGPLLEGTSPAVTTLASSAQVFTAELGAGVMAPGLEGAIEERGAAPGSILSRSGGFTIRISAPPGSTGYVVPFGRQYPARVTRSATFDSRLVELAVDPPPGAADPGAELRTFVVTPAGHGYLALWRVKAYDKPPLLTAAAPFAPLSFDVPIDGRASPGCSVLVDGAPVAVAADGRWSVRVYAGLLPRSVQVVARDGLGNSAATTLSVVAVLDYRQLPWVPIIVLVVVATALLLYVRAPRTRPRSSVTDALEEIEEQ